jgi:hypothetical protein
VQNGRVGVQMERISDEMRMDNTLVDRYSD